MPLIIPANTLDSSYEIDHSLRLNDGDSPRLNRTTSTATNDDMATLSVWYKRCTNDANQTLIGWNSGNGAQAYFRVFNSGNNLQLYNRHASETATSVITNAKFRDNSAWYHIVLKYDAAQSTDSDRVKFYINGEEQTSLGTANYPPQNTPLAFNYGSRDIFVGCWNNSSEFLDGYITEFNYVDGQALAPTEFGETNNNGVWIPKKYSGSYGNNGFFLDFREPNIGNPGEMAVGNIGADYSGNGNHFSSTGITTLDQTTDTPTNSFCTINPLANYYNPATLSEGNTRVDFANDVSTSYVISTIGVASGKWYCEVKGVDIPSYGEIGIASRPRQDDGNDDKMTANVNNYGYTANNGNVKSNGTAGSSYGNSYSDGDMIGIAMDLDNNKLYFSKNGTWQNSGDPTSGSTGTGAFSIAEASTTHDGVYYFAGGSNINNDNTRMDFNFGNPSFSISSGNADANGYGNFEYAVPSGYYALCTKNLAEFGG
jgi:hypothetical protein